jgi:hypothetical protein
LGERHFDQNQCAFIVARNSGVMGLPESEQITESTPQRGHNAVWPSSTHSTISDGGKTAQQ